MTPNQPEQPSTISHKELEAKIDQLVNESASNSVNGNQQEALDKAKRAVLMVKRLQKLRKFDEFEESAVSQLTFKVIFNLANQYLNNDMDQEAIDTFASIIENKEHKYGGRLRVNIGNIYFTQKRYPAAIKMYRMALDLLTSDYKEMREKIRRNIAIALVKIGNFREAVEAYEAIVEGTPDHSTIFNLLLCLYAIGDKARLKRYFKLMVDIEIAGLEGRLEDSEELLRNGLGEELRERKRLALKCIVDAAKLIAPVIEDDIIEGYDWLIGTVQDSQYNAIQSEVEISRALTFLKKSSIEKAIEALKSFEKKDKAVMAKAASNISYLYFLEGDYVNAEKYAEIAVRHDRFNAKALVNRGNCFYVKNEFMKAKELYLQAITVQADCVEALYNLAFVNKKLNMFMEALQVWFSL